MVDKLFFRGELFALRCSFKNLPMLCPIFLGSVFYKVFYIKDGLDFPSAHGYRSVRSVGGGHRACEYHATLVSEKQQGKPNSQSSPQTAPIDDAVNLTSEKHDPNAQMNHLHKRRKQKDLAEGTGVVPAKYTPKVKLEIFSQL